SAKSQRLGRSSPNLPHTSSIPCCAFLDIDISV
ncbi:MAG: hypothetical protein ACI9O4_000487, partial [Chitinophagales bacterium]